MNALTLGWHTIHCMQNNQELDKLLQKHRLLFQDELGKLQGVTVKLHVHTSAHPKFCKARAVPLALYTKKSRGSFRQVGSPRCPLEGQIF